MADMEPESDFGRICFQKKSKNGNVRFDYTRTNGLHVNPCRGTPEAAQNKSLELTIKLKYCRNSDAHRWVDTCARMYLHANAINLLHMHLHFI